MNRIILHELMRCEVLELGFRQVRILDTASAK
jgi:hypothetical protein